MMATFNSFRSWNYKEKATWLVTSQWQNLSLNVDTKNTITVLLLWQFVSRFCFVLVKFWEKFDDTKWVIRSRNSKNDRQCNGEKKDRQYNGEKKDRQYNGEKKDRQYNGKKKDRQYNGEKKDQQYNGEKKDRQNNGEKKKG